MILRDIDWLGLTAITITPTIIIVDHNRIATIVQEAEIVVIDLVEKALDVGPEYLEQLLDYREVMLSYESLMDEIDTYTKRHGV